MKAPKDIPIRELALRAGVTTRTIRHFESIGLIEPHRRESGQVRHYAPEALERLHLILRLQSSGLTLSQIKDILDSGRVGATGGQLARSILEKLEKQQEEMVHTFTELASLLNEIQKTIHILERCLSCTAVPHPERCPRCKVVSSCDEVPCLLSIINPNMPRGSPRGRGSDTDPLKDKGGRQ